MTIQSVSFPLTKNIILTLLDQYASKIRQKFHVRKLGLFGSYVRGDANPQSDIDILVEFEMPTFDAYMDLKFFLEDLFHRNIDLVMEDTLKPRIKSAILTEVQYGQRLQTLPG
jgi:predicted nucleotidyltransferase